MVWSFSTRIGAYEIISPLGAGGMAEVFRARDGKCLLVAEDPSPTAEPGLDVVVNWSAEVERKVKEAGTP